MHDAQKIRAVLVFCILLFAYLCVAIRLFYVQILHNSFYTDLGSRQYHVMVTQLPSRAPIIDRNGTFLALNKEVKTAFLLPKRIAHESQLKEFLEKQFPQALARLEASKNKQFLYIKRRLTQAEYDSIIDSNIPDIHILTEPGRFYPLGSVITPVVGLVDVDTHGLSGIELLFDKTLSGTPTTYALEKDARSDYFYFNKIKTTAGIDGEPVQLTIDADLQFIAYQELCATIKEFQAELGAVLIMNPKTGEILAMTQSSLQEVQNDVVYLEQEVTKNIIVSNSYELGSVIKIYAALAALEEGVVTSDELINCRSTKTAYIDGRRINTPVAHGTISFTDVIAKSNNIGMAIVAKRVGESLYDHYSDIGCGSKTGIEFPGEVAGFLNPVKNWSKQSIISLSYGYEVSLTLLQLAMSFCMIANNGSTVRPTLVINPEYSRAPFMSQKLYSDATIESIKQILQETTLHGTAKRAGIHGYKIMSKTGTANIVVNGQYDPSRNLFTCAGIVERGDYQRVIVTFTKEANKPDIFAATVAAPLFERVAEQMLIHDRIIN